MSAVHLIHGWARSPGALEPQVWCGEPKPLQFVSEALFADCKACLEARTKAATEVKPKPAEVNPWG